MPAGDRWFFDAIAPVYDVFMFGADREALAAAVASADGAVTRVVEVGGGTGRVLRAIDARRRVLVDTSPGMLRRAPRNLDRVLGDAARLPLSDDDVDVVLIVDALHHFPDAAAALREAARVLRPGGVLVVRDFDPRTRRGRAIAILERVARLRSTFRSMDAIATLAADAGLDPTVTDRGFVSTVVARKPGA